jgi:Mrp family chromosome partitioning ATPase
MTRKQGCAALFDRTAIPILAFVENMSFFLCPSIAARAPKSSAAAARAPKRNF